MKLQHAFAAILLITPFALLTGCGGGSDGGLATESSEMTLDEYEALQKQEERGLEQDESVTGDE